MKKLSASLLLVLASSLSLAHSEPAAKAPVAVEQNTKIHLASASASIVDLKSGKRLYDKNADVPVPIASITKLMTAMVILDGKQSMKESITFTRNDRTLAHNYYSRIRTQSKLSRADVIRIMLMSSENLAATALASNYLGGFKAFVKAMNAKAKALGMHHSRFVDSSGLSPNNVSTAADLTRMVSAAAKYALIRDYSTTKVFTANFEGPRYRLAYTNTNALVRGGSWDIRLSKTGYLDEAGRCLVMLAKIDNREVVMVMLDSFGKRTPTGDANRIRKWIQTGNSGDIAGAARDYERRRNAALQKR
ncbi:D-alanyl-D-alanine endopeptidase [Marinobacterium aestuarii]|uniref:D-alanyl-D-alanine endopeptidase n=1 Tax=Marinobacterium aestuarii TaxID=1821621 RepID=A0A1A9F591_9GAMM|nr:D-alanyl-D-alanine endopeptidase [Marinobacterium aestuarii]ANG65242.1 D-alanyl-D-alanine endopeptidase [Marinobacterium aestuarii]